MPTVEAVARVLRMLEMGGLVKTHGMREITTQEDSDERVMVYLDALDGIGDEELLAAARVSLRESRFFPSAADLRERARPKIAESAARTDEAAKMYQRVLRCNTYAPEGGAFWSYRQIESEVGRAAADAFLAAGGHEAFAVSDAVGDQFRFKRFVEAYGEAHEGRAAALRLSSAGGFGRALGSGE